MRHPWLLGFAAIALVGCHPSKVQVDAGVPDAGPRVISEKEPDDGAGQAIAIDSETQVNAELSAKGDEDWYRLESPAPTAVDLEVSAIPGAQVQLELLDAAGDRLALSQSDTAGKPVHLANVGVVRPVFVRVSSATRGAGGSYTLLAHFHPLAPGHEVEPDDRAADATPLAFGALSPGVWKVQGVIGHAGDEDWFRIELTQAPGWPGSDAGVPDAGAGELGVDAGSAGGMGPQGALPGGAPGGGAMAPANGAAATGAPPPGPTGAMAPAQGPGPASGTGAMGQAPQGTGPATGSAPPASGLAPATTGTGAMGQSPQGTGPAAPPAAGSAPATGAAPTAGMGAASPTPAGSGPATGTVPATGVTAQGGAAGAPAAGGQAPGATSASAGQTGASGVDGGANVSDAGTAAAALPAEPEKLPIHIQLTGVPGVRLEVDVMTEAEAQLFSAKADQDGQGLELRNVGVRKVDRVIYLVVKSSWSGTGRNTRRGFNPEASYTLTVSPESAGENSEIEPNDTLDQGTPTPDNGYKDGFLAPKSDIDFYDVRCPAQEIADLSVSGVNQLDLVLSVVRPSRDGGTDEEVLHANDGDLKEPEYLNSVACSGDLFVRVEGASKKVSGHWVRDYENPDQPYRLTVKSHPDTGVDEQEPNNTPDDATPIAFGHPMRGTIQPKRDADDYRIDLSTRVVKTALKAIVTPILKVRLGLYLYRLEADGQLTLVQTADRARGERPEVIRYSADPGVYILQVRDVRNRESNFQDAYQLIVEQTE